MLVRVPVHDDNLGLHHHLGVPIVFKPLLPYIILIVCREVRRRLALIPAVLVDDLLSSEVRLTDLEGCVAPRRHLQLLLQHLDGVELQLELAPHLSV